MCDEEKERTTNILARHHQGLRVHGSALHLRVRVDNEHGPQAGNRGGRRRVHAGELDVTFEAARRGRQRCMLDTCTGCDYDNMRTEHGSGWLHGVGVYSSGYFEFLYRFNGHVPF
jgi:hypothetical protein